MSSESELAKAATYEPLVGAEFQVHIAPDRVLTAKLIEVSNLKPATLREDLPIRKDPFSMVFKINGETQFDQGTFLVQHATVGAKKMFMVPIGFGEYEVIFN